MLSYTEHSNSPSHGSAAIRLEQICCPVWLSLSIVTRQSKDRTYHQRYHTSCAAVVWIHHMWFPCAGKGLFWLGSQAWWKKQQSTPHGLVLPTSQAMETDRASSCHAFRLSLLTWRYVIRMLSVDMRKLRSIEYHRHDRYNKPVLVFNSTQSMLVHKHCKRYGGWWSVAASVCIYIGFTYCHVLSMYAACFFMCFPHAFFMCHACKNGQYGRLDWQHEQSGRHMDSPHKLIETPNCSGIQTIHSLSMLNRCSDNVLMHHSTNASKLHSCWPETQKTSWIVDDRVLEYGGSQSRQGQATWHPSTLNPKS